jgi:uncharacterized membrane protein
MDRFAATVVTLVVMFICDYVWLSNNKASYTALVNKVQKRDKFTINIPAAVVVYLFVALAFIGILSPNLEIRVVQSKLLTEAILEGALFGLAVYGIYNATNMAIFANYDMTIAIMDTLWGTVLFAIASGCYVWLRRGTKN